MEILFYLVLAVAVIAYLRSKRRRTPTSLRPPADQTPWPTQQERRTELPPTTPDPLAWQKDQLSQAALASYRPRRLMNREEHQVFQATERAARAMQAGHRVFARCSLRRMMRRIEPSTANVSMCSSPIVMAIPSPQWNIKDRVTT